MKKIDLVKWTRSAALAGGLLLLPLTASVGAQTGTANDNTARTTVRSEDRRDNDHDYGWLGLVGLAGLLGLIPKKRTVVHDDVPRDRNVNR
jgi:hypothetical protein